MNCTMVAIRRKTLFFSVTKGKFKRARCKIIDDLVLRSGYYCSQHHHLHHRGSSHHHQNQLLIHYHHPSNWIVKMEEVMKSMPNCNEYQTFLKCHWEKRRLEIYNVRRFLRLDCGQGKARWQMLLILNGNTHKHSIVQHEHFRMHEIKTNDCSYHMLFWKKRQDCANIPRQDERHFF